MEAKNRDGEWCDYAPVVAAPVFLSVDSVGTEFASIVLEYAGAKPQGFSVDGVEMPHTSLSIKPVDDYKSAFVVQVCTA